MGSRNLASVIHDVQAIRYSQIASGMIIFYDHLVTLDEEVNLIWRTSWSWGKGLFLLNRYFGLISSMAVLITSYKLSRSFFQWQGWTGLIACMIAEIILQMRLYAMYSLNKKLLAVMGILFIISLSASAAIVGTVLSKIAVFVFPLTLHLRFCIPVNIGHYFYAFWIPMLAFETLLCGLALYKGYKTFRGSASPLGTGTRLVSILIRDSLLYFLAIFATYLTNLLVFVLAEQNLLETSIGFSVAMSCVMGNRMVMNVRRLKLDLSLETQDHAISRSRTTRKSQHEALRIERTSLSSIEMVQLRSMRANA